MKRRCPVASASAAEPDAPALFFENSRFTWSEAEALVAGAVAKLASLGVGAGDRVAIRTANRPEVAWFWFATVRLGATLVPLNARLTDSEVAPLLERSQAKVTLGSLPGGVSLDVTPSKGGPVEIDDEQVIVGLFTSGTTGSPKLVELTQANFRANAKANASRLGGEATQRWFGVLPLFHIGGLAMLYRCAAYGASLVLDSTFDAGRACTALDAGCTHTSFVPTMLDRVIDARGQKPFTGIHAALIGGGPMSSAQLARARAAGIPVLQTYGLTEACSQVTTEAPQSADGSTAGEPLDGVEVRIVNADADGVGEIEVRGPTVARGQGEWLHTRDLGALDSRGRLKIYARRTDLIVTGGENVYPAEVEAVLREHPSIRDVAVIGRDDAQWGQVSVAVVVTDEASDDVLRDWARQRLAGFKVPRVWVRAEQLPRNATGKIDRTALKALAG
ncbi:MAG: class I adenylate-forming enzyme family protein [Archangium sp.]